MPLISETCCACICIYFADRISNPVYICFLNHRCFFLSKCKQISDLECLAICVDIVYGVRVFVCLCSYKPCLSDYLEALAIAERARKVHWIAYCHKNASISMQCRYIWRSQTVCITDRGNVRRYD